MDKRIEELASQNEYKEAAGKLSCFIGVKTHTALSVIVEVGDFKRFANAQNFASYLGIVPGEDTSSENQNRLSISLHTLHAPSGLVSTSPVLPL